MSQLEHVIERGEMIPSGQGPTPSPWTQRRLSLRVALGIPVALVLGLVILRGAGPADSDTLRSFTIIAVAIVAEALPFVLVGALVAAAIEVFVGDRWFERAARLPPAVQLPAAALGGMTLPVCECGSVPIARRLLVRGLTPAAALTFMLAAPVLNPIVLLSTAVAYQGREVMLAMVVGRAVLGFVVAVVTGWAIGGSARAASDLLRDAATEVAHCHSHAEVKRSRRSAFFDHVLRDFSFMARFVVIGGMLAGVVQTFVPRSILASFAESTLLAVGALMLLAFLLSLCSEADAFVAVSLVQFPLASQLAFLVFGPVFDVKLGFLYGSTFKGRAVMQIAFIAAVVVVAGALWFEVVVT